jgi:hypothetical protein
MGYSNAGLNAAVDGIAAAGSWIQGHTADPGVAGTTAPAGARAQTTWTDDGDGTTSGSQVSIAQAAGVTLTYWSLWSASVNGVFLGSWALGAPEAFGAAGTWKHTPTLTAIN